MKIVVVDDSKMARKSIIGKLPESIREKADIFEGENGKEAVFLHKTTHPDLILLDLTMPIMDGYEALESIKKSDPDARVFIVTADVQPKAREKVMALGATGYITKDVDAQEVKKIFDSMNLQ